jgi:hypothetical protein
MLFIAVALMAGFISPSYSQITPEQLKLAQICRIDFALENGPFKQHGECMWTISALLSNYDLNESKGGCTKYATCLCFGDRNIWNEAPRIVALLQEDPEVWKGDRLRTLEFALRKLYPCDSNRKIKK